MATTVQPATGETTKQLVNYRTDGGVAVIEMCDPPANTYTYEMNRQLDEAILKARMDNDVYVIVMTGAGDKFFSAGANIKMLTSVDPTFKDSSVVIPAICSSAVSLTFVPCRFSRFNFFQSLIEAIPSSVTYSAKYRFKSVMPGRLLISAIP